MNNDPVVPDTERVAPYLICLHCKSVIAVGGERVSHPSGPLCCSHLSAIAVVPASELAEARKERDEGWQAYRNLSLALPDDYAETHQKRREAESQADTLRAALEAVKIWAEDKTGVDNEHPLSIGYRRAQGDAVDRIDRALSEQDKQVIPEPKGTLIRDLRAGEMSESAEQTRVRYLRIAEQKRDKYKAEVSTLRAAIKEVVEASDDYHRGFLRFRTWKRKATRYTEAMNRLRALSEQDTD